MASTSSRETVIRESPCYELFIGEEEKQLRISLSNEINSRFLNFNMHAKISIMMNKRECMISKVVQGKIGLDKKFS